MCCYSKLASLMLNLILPSTSGSIKMVKTKRDIKSPRKRISGTISRPISRARPTTTHLTTANVSANIRVVIRVRPPNNKEQGDNQRNIINIVDDQLLIFDPVEDSQPFFYHGVQQKGRDLLKKANKNLQFIFDKVFGFDASNEDVFKTSTKNLITSLMDGFNCSVFVYGATGAGKTHTMLGSNENPGITFLTMAELFRRKEELIQERDFELGITYLEVYNECVQDLLHPGVSLQLREDGKYGVTVSGIQVKKVENVVELFELLKLGNQHRTQHPTDANAESSRSHAVFQVYIRMNIRTTGEVRLAKLSMIDLAGSERGAATGCAGARFTEGANINKSLLALGNCINSLADGQRHIPYRDSKLTRLLKDSLGGNCQTVMIANVSPSSLSYEDTYNTLKYATRAKKIKSNMKKNVVKCEMHVEQYVKLVEELNKEVERLKEEIVKKKCDCKTEIVNNNNNDHIRAQLDSLYVEQTQLLERLYHLENNEQVLNKRIKLKEEADSRLSGLCFETPQKLRGHKRLGSAVDRLQRQNNEIKEEIETLKTRKIDLELKSQELISKTEEPTLQPIFNLHNTRLAQTESKYKVELLQKINKIQETELHSRGVLLEQMSKMLRSSYLQAKGHGYVSDSFTKEYFDLIKQLQGVCSVSWGEEIADSGLSSTESNTTITVEEEGRGSKRKLIENIASSTTSLDNTFVLSAGKSKALSVCAEQLMAKVYKPPPAKRFAKLGSASPRNKENHMQMRRPIGTMGTAQRFPCGQGDNKRNRIRKPEKPLNQLAAPVNKARF